MICTDKHTFIDSITTLQLPACISYDVEVTWELLVPSCPRIKKMNTDSQKWTDMKLLQ